MVRLLSVFENIDVVLEAKRYDAGHKVPRSPAEALLQEARTS